MIIIGSNALRYWFPDFPREPKDYDIIGRNLLIENEMIINEGKRIEYLINPILESECKSNTPYLGKNELYTLKISHSIGWDINWEKHIFDIQFLKSKGCELNKDLFEKLYSFWNKLHGNNKRSKLDMSAEEFFDNAVNCPYDHDYLHTLLNPYPTFNKVLKDGADVEVEEWKFDKLSFEEKCNLVTEEVMVMAFERWPNINYRRAYSKMLKRFILNHAPIFEAIFILENYIELHKPKFNYFKMIEEGIENNKAPGKEL